MKIIFLIYTSQKGQQDIFVETGRKAFEKRMKDLNLHKRPEYQSILTGKSKTETIDHGTDKLGFDFTFIKRMEKEKMLEVKEALRYPNEDTEPYILDRLSGNYTN